MHAANFESGFDEPPPDLTRTVGALGDTFDHWEEAIGPPLQGGDPNQSRSRFPLNPLVEPLLVVQ